MFFVEFGVFNMKVVVVGRRCNLALLRRHFRVFSIDLTNFDFLRKIRFLKIASDAQSVKHKVIEYIPFIIDYYTRWIGFADICRRMQRK